MKTTPEDLLHEVTAIHCPVCGLGDSTPWKTLKGYTLDRCRACSMIFVNPCPTEEALQAAYALPKKEYNRFFQSDYLETEFILGGDASWQTDTSHHYLDKIEKYLGRKGRILELGCGPGVFLEVAQSRGWKTAGVDPGNWRKDNNTIDKELNIHRASLFDVTLPDSSFDVIFMASVLEHLNNPTRYLEKLFQLLLPGGILFAVGLPNIQSWTIRLGVDRWIGNHPPLHLLYFSRKTAELLFCKTGFQDIRIRSYGLSETVLEAIFNRTGDRYTGSYTAHLHKPTLFGRALKTARSMLYFLFDLTGTGSVLEVVAGKP